jgi:heme-degrading monooxygenase HmoA
MAYIYRVSFTIRPDQMTELQIGASLERVLGYLRTLLPSQPGFMETRALLSVDKPEKTDIVCFSEWEQWEDLENHHASSLAEEKVLAEFAPHITREDLTIRIYGEVD